MIEITVLNYLKGKVDVPVLMEIPEKEIPDQFVIVQKIGGGKRNHILSASFAFQSYSLSSLYAAASLDEDVRAAMDDMAELSSIGSCRMASNYEFTDTHTKRYRYQCTYDINYKED